MPSVPSPSSVLAFATTIHLSLALLRKHRRQAASPLSAVALVSFSMAALPWIFPTPIGVCAGLALHIAWFVACERFVPTVLAPAAATTLRSTPVPAAEPARAATRRAAASSPGQRKGFVPTPIIATFDESADVKTIRVLRRDGFEFEAGQFLPVRIRIEGKDYVRCYSISSPPHVRGYLEISVKRMGIVSNALHATARPGAMLSVKPPAGAFKFPSGDDRPIVLLAGGIGITPLISMLRHAIAVEPTRPVTLIYAARSEAGFAFRDELASIPARHPHAHVYFVASRDATLPHVYRGHIDEELLRTVVPELRHSISFICGPEPMLEGMRSLLASMGVPSSQVRFEVFQAAVAVAAGVGAGSPSTAAGAKGAAAHAMNCARSGKEVSVQPGQTLLEAAEGGGVEVPSLCRAGVCGTCRLQVTEGDVHCESTMLSADERSDGFVLACVSTASSDCTVQV